MPQPLFIAETQSVRRLAQNKHCKWQWRRHFFDEAAKETPPVTQPDVQHALSHGTVTLVEYKKDILWRVEGKDLDDRSIVVVVAVFEPVSTIRVVTVWAVKKKK